MKTEIVIARYNENLDWLKKIKKSKDIKITVYNKGKDDIEVPFIPLQNKGGESQTYLYHIINNYDNLADQTIFCKGDSIFHSPNFLDLINKYRKKFEPVQPLSAWDFSEKEHPNFLSNPPLPILEKTKDLWFGKKARVHVEYMDNNFVTVYPYNYIEYNFIKFVNKVKYSYGIENPLKFNVERFLLKDVDLDYLFPVCYAGLFSINREAILENSFDFYNNIMSILIYDIRNFTKNKKIDHGLFLEKLWLVIFNYKKYNKNYIPLKVKDYELKKIKTFIKDNSSNFSYFNIYCQLFLNITLDDNIYNVFISKNIIYFKKSYDNYNKLYSLDTLTNKNIISILKDKTKYNVLVQLKNNILQVIINDNLLIDYNFDKIKYNHNSLNDVVVNDISKYNKFTDNFIDYYNKMLSIIKNIPNIKTYPLEYVFEKIGLKHKSDTLWLEFGVATGKTINYISKFTNKTVYGFDSFEGLPEKWRNGYNKGAFSNNGKLPKVNDNVVLIKGWIDKTLPKFIKKYNNKISFIHIDVDLYSSTKCILNILKDYIDKECIIVFDELVNYDGFDGSKGELKAFYEFITENNVNYEWIGMNGTPTGMLGYEHENVALIIHSIN
jgi:hypothetical protein